MGDAISAKCHRVRSLVEVVGRKDISVGRIHRREQGTSKLTSKCDVYSRRVRKTGTSAQTIKWASQERSLSLSLPLELVPAVGN